MFGGWARLEGDGLARAASEPGPVELREPGPAAYELVLPALGRGRRPAGPGRIASVGRAGLLLPVANRDELAALAPDFERLRAACDRLGPLDVYVCSAPTREGRAAARMFAPSTGVDEDIANADSTACLAATLTATPVPARTAAPGPSSKPPQAEAASRRALAAAVRA
ncbi:PhzF family phenazine biosynthesis protein [Streptomyces sp. R301]|uniref:PhzF family phenazine biosynthesis protein n=1 Tax=unclassified Streptomyces TaxID=2593676 RepID=UPI003211F437